MEGLLSVPPERNIIGRGNWKYRYVVLAPTTSSPSSPSLLHRPATIAGKSSKDGPYAVAAGDHDQDCMLSIYKQKFDVEPIAVYPIQAIASCYVGDVAQKKAFGSIKNHSRTSFEPLMPTLILHLRASSVTRPVRRKSHIEGLKLDLSRDSSTASPLTLLFRAGPVDSPALVTWAREIQSRTTGTVGTIDRRESPAGAFTKFLRSRNTIYGEPRAPLRAFESLTANSEATKSKVSLASVSSVSTSDGASLFSGTTSTPLSPAPILDHSDEEDTFRNPFRRRSYTVDSSPRLSPLDTDTPQRETILDRAFKLNYIPAHPTSPSPSPSPSPSSPLTSVARFEALSVDLDRVNNQYNFSLDRSVMPASFFADLPHPRSNSLGDISEQYNARRGRKKCRSSTVRALSPFGKWTRDSLSLAGMHSPTTVGTVDITEEFKGGHKRLSICMSGDSTYLTSVQVESDVASDHSNLLDDFEVDPLCASPTEGETAAQKKARNRSTRCLEGSVFLSDRPFVSEVAVRQSLTIM